MSLWRIGVAAAREEQPERVRAQVPELAYAETESAGGAAGGSGGAPSGGGGGAPGGGGGGGGNGGGPGPFQAAIDKLTRWIPSETLALYVPGVTALAAKDFARPSVALLVAFVVLTPLFVAGAAFAASGSVAGTIWLSAGLGMVAFVIWSLTVPFSGWQRWDVVADNQVEVALAAAAVGILFGFGAEGLTKKFGHA